MERHPLIEGLVESLPPEGTVWTDDGRAAWFDAAAACFRLVWPDFAKPGPEEDQEPGRTPEKEPPRTVARGRGKRRTRRPSPTAAEKAEIRELRGAGKTLAQVAIETGFSGSTVARVLKAPASDDNAPASDDDDPVMRALL